MVRPQCIVQWQMTDQSRNSPGRVYEGVLEQLFRRGIWWYNGLESSRFVINPKGDDPSQLPYDTTSLRSYPGHWRGLGFGWGASGDATNRLEGKSMQTSSLYGNMDWWDEENSEYYNVTRNDGSAAKLPNVPYPVGDDLHHWLTVPDKRHIPIGPQVARGVKLPRWEWTGRDLEAMMAPTRLTFRAARPETRTFPARNADGSIMSTVALIKTPYGANKKRADDATLTIQVLQENMNLNFADYS
ncbi:hypothetical protein BB8028_0002g07740 [Beauveria bassiana]|uniref:Uncharacterized protein n=1 Tax=Beauveria bassiana TaxID=176275 RepID=A0A2S7Y3K2_BEABA|nr:hypothetical protein BB8028_0002g07740 [Beauveria bassiana]